MGFKIGNVEIRNNIVMAPMAGISNPAYIKIIEEMGVGLAYTELLSSEAIIRDNKKTFEMLNGLDDIKIPVAVQLFGSNADVMAKAAKKLCDNYNIKIIDINMGCPVPKVALRSNAGSALLKDLDKIKEIVRKVSSSVPVPVTVKIRSGWDNNNINAVEVARICEESGAKAICIHARTRSQGYSGIADWEIIKNVKQNVNIPVIGNGDIRTIYDSEKMINETKCDAIMIGRALLGNPWFIKEVQYYLEKGIILSKPSNNDKISMAIKHLMLLSKYKNEKLAVLEMRNHIAWYIKGLKNSSEIKNKIYKCNRIDDIISILNSYFEEIGDDICETTIH